MPILQKNTMRKKVLSLLAVSVLAIGMLAGCGNSSNKTEDKENIVMVKIPCKGV